jgi:NTE family protein
MAVRTALVLGAGGVTAAAWQAGMVAGMADLGLELDADRVIGTGCGALVAAQLTSGRDPQRVTESLAAPLASLRPTPWTAPLRQAVVQLQPSHKHAVQVLGRTAIRDWTPLWQAVRIEQLAADLVGVPWPKSLVVVATNAVTGRPAYFTAREPLDVATAVAASWAVAGIHPAVRVDSQWYFDGALRSPLNADVASGAASVIVLAPVGRVGDVTGCGRRQAQGLRNADSVVRLIRPDRASRIAMAVEADLGRGVGATMAAGRDQGQCYGAQFAGQWPGLG